MRKKNNTEPQYVTKEILKKELSKWEGRLTGKIESLDTKIDGVEQRLDTKIDAKVDSAVQSMKDYTDSRFTQLDTRIDGLEQTIYGFGRKLDTAVNGIVQMLERSFGTQVKVNERMEDHEQRITKLEEQSI